MTDREYLEALARSLNAVPTLPKPPESDPGQLDLFDTGRGLAKRQKRDYDAGQDFLFELRDKGE